MANPLEASLRLRDEFTKVLSKIDNQLQKTTSTMENFKQKMSAQSKAFSTIASSAQSAMAKLNSAFQKGFSAVHNMVQSSVQRIVTLMGNFGNRIKSGFNLNPLISKVSDTFSKITSTIRSKVSDIGNSLKDVGSRIAKTLKLDKVFSGITKGLDTLKAKVGTTVSAIASSFSNIFKSKRVKALDDINSQLDKLGRKKANIEVNVANAENAQRRLANFDTAISKLNSKKAKVETQIAGVEKATSQLASVNSSIEKLNSKKAEVEAKLTGGAQVEDELADINSQLDKLANKKARLEIKAESVDVEKATKRLDDINSKLNRLNSTRATLQVEANKVEGARKKLSEVQQDIHRLNREKASLQLNINPFTRALSSARSAFDSFKNTVSNGIRNMGTAFRNFGDNMRNSFSHMSSTAGKVQSVFGGIMTALGVTAALGAIKNGIVGISEELNTNSKAWQVFQDNMSMLGKGQGEIDTVKKSLQEFATQTIYNASDMASTYSQMAAIGVKDTENLVKGMAGLASSAEAPGQAMKTLSQQMTQAVAKPELQWMDFKLMMEQAPAGMAQVAKEMGYSLDDFIIAIQDSEIASEDFAAAVAKVGTNENFSKMATEFKTVGQAMDGMRESLANKLEPAFSVFNETGIRAVEAFTGALDRINFDGLADKLKAFTDTLDFDAIVDGLAGFASKAKAKITDFMDGFKSTGAMDSFVEALESVWDALKHVADNIDFKAIGKIAGEVVDTFSKITKAVGDFVSEIDPNAIGKISTAIAGLAAAFIAFKAVKGVFDIGKGLFNVGGAVTQLFGDLFGGKKGIKTPKGNPLEEAIPKGMSGSGGLGFLDNLGKTANQFAKGAKNIALIYGVIKLIEELAEALKQVNDKVPADLSSLGPKLGNMAIALTGMGTFVAVAGRIARNNFGNAVKGLAMIAGISANIMLASEAMQQVDAKVPENTASFTAKLANMAIAITGMGALVGVAGKFATTNPTSAITGLALVAGISGELMLAAEAMQQVNDKVSGDIGGFSAKVANIAIGIGAMTGLVAIAGLFASANPVGAVAGLAMVALLSGELMIAAEAMQQVNDKVTDDIASFSAKIANVSIGIGAMAGLIQVVGTLTALNPIGAVAGLATVALIAGELILVAEAMQQVNDKVPADTKAVTKKIEGIKDVVKTIADTSFTEVLGSIGGAISMAAAIDSLNAIAEMTVPLQRIADADVPVEAVKTKISQIKDAIAELSIDSFSEWLGNLVGYESFDTAITAVSALQEVANTLKSLSEIELDHASARAMVNQLKLTLRSLTLDSLGDIFENLLGYEDFGQAVASVDALKQVATKLAELNAVELDHASARATVNQLKLTLQSLSVDSLGEAIDNLLGYDNFGSAVESVNALKQVATKLAELATVEIDHAASRAMVNQLKLTLRSLSREGFGEFIADLLGYDDFSSAVDSVNALKQVATKLAELSAVEIDHASARAMVNQLKLTLRSLSREGFGEFIADLLGYDDFSGAVDSVNALIKIANQLVTLSAVEIDLSAVRTRISEIKSAISSLNSFPVVSDNSESYSMASTAITKLTEIRNHLTTLGAVALDVGAVTNTINSIKTAIAQLNSLPTVAVANFGSINGLITSVINLATQINRLSTSTQASATGVVSAFSRIGQSANTMRNQTTTALNGMVLAITGSMARARSSAVSGMAGFTSAISSGMARSASIARSGSAQIASAFSGLRGQLYSAGLFAMSGLSSGISAGAGGALSAARRVANSVSSTIRSALKIHSPSRVMIAIGEFVSEGLAKGITSAGKLVDKASTKLADLAVPRMDDIPGPSVRVGEVLTSGLNAFTAPQMELAGVTRNITDVYAGQGDYDWDDTQRVSIDSSEIDAMDASLSRPVIIKNKQITPEINLTIEGKDAEDIDTDEIIRRIEEIIIDANNDDLG